MISAIVPVKLLDRAKSRLSPLLSPHERRALVVAMLEDVLAALGSCAAVDTIMVTSRDATVGAVARRMGAAWMLDQGHDLNSSLEGAARRLAASAGGILVLPADVPMVTPADLEAFVGAGSAPGVTIAPSRDGGTNGLLVRPPLALPFLFGVDSMARHQQAARERELPLRMFANERLAHDIDRPADLAALLDAPAALASARLARDLPAFWQSCCSAL